MASVAIILYLSCGWFAPCPPGLRVWVPLLDVRSCDCLTRELISGTEYSISYCKGSKTSQPRDNEVTSSMAGTCV